MRCLSTHTELPDPFEAGLALGKHLTNLIPDVILVFASSRHLEWTEIHEGLVFGLGRTDVQIVGCCSDGVYARSGVYDLGISALAFHLGSSVRMHITAVPNAGSLGRQAGISAATATLAVLPNPSIAIALIDGITCDGGLIAEGLSTLPCPVIGGMATDSVRNELSRVFLNGALIEDAVVLLAFAGPLRFRSCSVSGWVPIGIPGRVEDSEGRTIRRINGISAQMFVDRQFGRVVTNNDLGIVPLAVKDDLGKLSMRAFQSIDATNGWLTNRSHVPTGSMIQVCDANSSDIISSLDTLAESLEDVPFTPLCLIAISCCGRKEILGTRTRLEIDRLLQAWAGDLPFTGFCSGGEIGPHWADETTGGGTVFHNVTLVATVIGL